ncbi:MAG: restriction endonuclease [Gemmatimonadaceae bacterium]
MFVTTAEFSGPAIDLARQHPIDLWDGKHLSIALAKIHGQPWIAPPPSLPSQGAA